MYTLAAADTIQAVAGTTTAISSTIDGMEYSVALGEVYKVLSQGQVATSVAALYTVPASTVAFISEIRLVNTTGSLVSGIIVYRGGTAASNQITGSFSIPAGGTALISFPGGMEVVDNLGNIYSSGTNIFDSTIPAVTTPLALGITGSAATAARRDHTHQSPGGIASITASVAIANTETQVVAANLPSGFYQAGTTLRVTAGGVQTTASSGAAGTFRVRTGSTTLTGNIATSVAATSAVVSAQGFYFEAIVVCRSTSAIIGAGAAFGGTAFTATVVPSATTATVAITSAQTNVIELTYISGTANTTLTFHTASIEVVKM